MAALGDASVGIGVESVYNTTVAPTRWYEFINESLDFTKNVKQGQGLRVGRSYDASPRRVVASTVAGGDVDMEVSSKGFGLLWQAALGTGTHTLVSGSTYQQLFTPLTGSLLPKLTVQKGVVQSGGTVQAYTMGGTTVTGWELTCPNQDLVTAKFTFDATSMSTGISYTSPSYPTAPVSLFHFAEGALTLGGSVTVPTATVMAVVGTPVATVRDFSMKSDNGLNLNRYNLDGTGRHTQPTVGRRAGTGQMTIEYTDQTVVNAYQADTPLALTLTFTSTQSLSIGFEMFQVTIPEIKLNGDIPNANGQDIIIQTVPFDILDNLVAPFPLYVSTRTADTAL